MLNYYLKAECQLLQKSSYIHHNWLIKYCHIYRHFTPDERKQYLHWRHLLYFADKRLQCMFQSNLCYMFWKDTKTAIIITTVSTFSLTNWHSAEMLQHVYYTKQLKINHSINRIRFIYCHKLRANQRQNEEIRYILINTYNTGTKEWLKSPHIFTVTTKIILAWVFLTCSTISVENESPLSSPVSHICSTHFVCLDQHE